MDPLSLLREFNVTGQLDQVQVAGDRVEFADKYAFSKSAKTAYKSNQGKGDLYPLEALLHFLRNKDVPHAAYIKAAREAGLHSVVFTDRKDLLAYLTGDSDTSDNIVATADVLLPDLGAAPEQPLSKRQRLDKDGEASREAEAGGGGEAGVGGEEGEEAPEKAVLDSLAQWEAQLRDRNSMLVVPGASFAGILSQLNTLLKEQHRREQQQQRKQQHRQPSSGGSRPSGGTSGGAGGGSIPVQPSNRYQRATVDQDSKRLGINTYGEVGDRPSSTAATPSTAPSSASKRPLGSSSSSRPHGPGSGAHRPGGPSPSSSRRGDEESRRPIILVPAALTSMISMWNAKHLLEDGTFRSSEECRASGERKVPRYEFRRRIGRGEGRGEPTYVITDKPPPRGSKDWQRVVAVVVQGVKWQFKDFPFKGADRGDLVDTFHKVMGVHLAFHDDQINETVKQWNVRLLRLHRTDRHKDLAVVQELYKYLDQFLIARKSALNY